MELVISVIAFVAILQTTNWSTSMGLLPKLWASPTSKLSCWSVSMMVELEALIILLSCQQIWWHGHQQQHLHLLIQTFLLNLLKPCFALWHLKSFLSCTMMRTINIKNNDGMHSPDAFQTSKKLFKTCGLYLTPCCHWHFILHYMCSGKTTRHVAPNLSHLHSKSSS